MTLQPKIATVFGGTGFIGRQVVCALARAGVLVKVATRVPERAYDLKTCGNVGQIVPVYCDYTHVDGVRAALKGSDYAVNCIGISRRRGRATFKKINTNLAGMIAQACRDEGVLRLVHFSALAAAGATSRFAATKRAGEEAVLAAFPAATILRPAPVFGPDDRLFNAHATLVRLMPVVPLAGGGRTAMQPVYVGDVAAAALQALFLSSGTPEDPRGRVFSLTGPETVTWRQFYHRVFTYGGRRRPLMPVPFALMKAVSFFLSPLPCLPWTPDRVETLKTDLVATAEAGSLPALGLNATAMETIVPFYLAKFRPGGPFRALQGVHQ